MFIFLFFFSNLNFGFIASFYYWFILSIHMEIIMLYQFQKLAEYFPTFNDLFGLKKIKESLHSKQSDIQNLDKNIIHLQTHRDTLIGEIQSLNNRKKLSIFSDEEYSHLINKKLVNDVLSIVIQFNDGLTDSLSKGEQHFSLYFEDLPDTSKLALTLVVNKLKKENIKCEIAHPVFEDTGGYGCWITHVSVDASNKITHTYQSNIKLKKHV